MSLLKKLAGDFVRRSESAELQGRPLPPGAAFEFFSGALSVAAETLPTGHPDRLDLLGLQVASCLHGLSIEHLRTIAEGPGNESLCHPRWRFTVQELPGNGLEEDSQTWELDAPDEATAIRFGQALAFQYEWAAGDTRTEIKRLDG